MITETFYRRILQPGLISLQSLGGPQVSAQAERFLLTVALQESGLRSRFQVLSGGKAGRAKGWFQFEPVGGVSGVMAHRASAALVERLCAYHEILHQREAIWRALEGHDFMAVAMARLLLLTDPFAIPTTESGAWNCYAMRLWRPGKPHPATWPAYWREASAAVDLPAGASA